MTPKITLRGINYGVWFYWPPEFWFHWFTPGFHEGRGPYVSIGFVCIAFGRGY